MVDLSGGQQKIDLSGSGRAGASSSGGGAASGSTNASGASGGLGGFGAGVAAAAVTNPTVQQHIQAAAFEQAQQGLLAAGEGAKELGTHLGSQLGKYIQEGPAGMSILCFLGGALTAVIGALGLLNIESLFTTPFTYVLHIYLTGFGLVATLLEADTASLSRFKVIGRMGPLVERYQTEIYRRAYFLTQLFGRGLFYFFVGSLAITQCLVCILFLVGLWNVLMGLICVLMSYGINPVEHLDGPQSSEYRGRGEQTVPLNSP